VSYSHAYLGVACAPVGLTCAYPGQGDEVTSPSGAAGSRCFATAMLWCVAAGADGGAEAGTDGGAEAGAEGGAGTWVFAQ
jgi:hypothetical protein